MGDCRETCPIALSCLRTALADEAWAKFYETAAEKAEATEMNTRFRFVELDDKLHKSETISPVLQHALRLFEHLSIVASKNADELALQAPQFVYHFRQKANQENTHMVTIVSACNITRALQAHIKRATHLNSYACGSTAEIAAIKYRQIQTEGLTSYPFPEPI